MKPLAEGQQNRIECLRPQPHRQYCHGRTFGGEVVVRTVRDMSLLFIHSCLCYKLYAKYGSQAYCATVGGILRGLFCIAIAPGLPPLPRVLTLPEELSRCIGVFDRDDCDIWFMF